MVDQASNEVVTEYAAEKFTVCLGVLEDFLEEQESPEFPFPGRSSREKVVYGS